LTQLPEKTPWRRGGRRKAHALSEVADEDEEEEEKK